MEGAAAGPCRGAGPSGPGAGAQPASGRTGAAGARFRRFARRRRRAEPGLRHPGAAQPRRPGGVAGAGRGGHGRARLPEFGGCLGEVAGHRATGRRGTEPGGLCRRLRRRLARRHRVSEPLPEPGAGRFQPARLPGGREPARRPPARGGSVLPPIRPQERALRYRRIAFQSRHGPPHDRRYRRRRRVVPALCGGPRRGSRPGPGLSPGRVELGGGTAARGLRRHGGVRSPGGKHPVAGTGGARLR